MSEFFRDMALAFWEFPIEFDFDTGCHRRHRKNRSSLRRSRTETEDAFTYLFVLPGVDRDAMDVSLYRNKVTVKAKKVTSSGEETVMEDSLRLPDGVDLDKVTAEAKNGVLHITVAKKEKEPTKVIPIESDFEQVEDAYKLEFEVPGAKVEDLSAKMEEGEIIVSATENEMGFFSSFKRTYTLPNDANREDLKACYKDGILMVQISKVEPATLAIKEEEPPSDENIYSTSVRMPGVPREKVDLSRIGQEVLLSVAREDKSTRREKLLLPEAVNAEEAVGFLRNGVLTITAPKKSFEQKKILVQTEKTVQH